MPVHAVEGGWRWGNHGHVYRTKAEAERQARAIYASGWREDAAQKKAKVAHHKAMKASPRAETRYVRDLKGILRGVHHFTEGAIKPFLEDLKEEPGLRHRRDASKDTVRSRVSGVLNHVIAGLKIHVAVHVGAAFDRMAFEVNKKNKAGLSLIGITPTSMGAEDVLKRARDANIKLVEDAGRDYAEDVRAIFEDDENFGLSGLELQDKLWELMEERGSVNESRAALIAVDQTLKTNAALTQDRFKKAGIEKYTWSTSLDERVRPMHAALEGQAFSFDDPPETNDDGETNNPGEDYRCRCLAIPLFEDEESESESESE